MLCARVCACVCVCLGTAFRSLQFTAAKYRTAALQPGVDKRLKASVMFPTKQNKTKQKTLPGTRQKEHQVSPPAMPDPRVPDLRSMPFCLMDRARTSSGITCRTSLFKTTESFTRPWLRRHSNVDKGGEAEQATQGSFSTTPGVSSSS